MSQDETRGLNKNLDFMRAISILFLVMNVYYFCYPYFLSMNLNIGVVDKILLNFQVSVSAILYCCPFLALISLRGIKMKHYGFRK